MTSKVIVYGATGAVGSHTARLLYHQNYSLHLVARNKDKLEQLGNELNAGITVGDANDPKLFKQVSKELSKDLSGLVYAVGTINLGSVRRLTASDFLEDFKINAMGAALAVQAVLPKLKKYKGTGSIVLFSSVAAQRGFAMHASMGMAKGAVDGLTRSLAAELAPKIRVNAISPSVTRTPLSEKILSNEQMVEAIEKKHPLKRLGTKEDIASLASFLISEKSGWITGQILNVDGGRSTIESTG